MKRISLALLAAVLPALSAAPHAATLGVSMALFDDNFLTAVRASMKERAQQLNVPIQFEDAQNDIGRQLPPRVSFVGSGEAQSGTLQMAEVCRLLQGKGEIVILIGELTNQAARQRTQDIYDVIARPQCRGIRVLEKQTANWKRTEAADLMTNWLSAGLRPQAVVANDDEMAIGAIQALKQAKLLSRTIVAGIDATPDGLAAMKAGDLKVTVFQNAPAQGTGAVDTALKLVRGESVASFVWVPFELVTPENLSNYLGRH